MRGIMNLYELGLAGGIAMQASAARKDGCASGSIGVGEAESETL